MKFVLLLGSPVKCNLVISRKSTQNFFQNKVLYGTVDNSGLSCILKLGGARKKAGVASKQSFIGQGLSRHTVAHRQGQK